MSEITKQIDKLMNRHLRTGSKDARRREVKKMKYFVLWVFQNKKGVKKVDNIGRKHVYEFYEHLQMGGMADKTIYNYFLAIEKIWIESEKKGVPPKPRLIEMNTESN